MAWLNLPRQNIELAIISSTSDKIPLYSDSISRIKNRGTYSIKLP